MFHLLISFSHVQEAGAKGGHSEGSSESTSSSGGSGKGGTYSSNRIDEHKILMMSLQNSPTEKLTQSRLERREEKHRRRLQNFKVLWALDDNADE